jgi:hypothetical protein
VSVTIAHVVVVLAGVLACAPMWHRDDVRPDPSAGTFVSVRNDNLADADVYAIRLGDRYRLGTVISHTTGRFRVPSTLLDGNELRVYVHLIGGGDFFSEAVQVNDDLEPRLDVQPTLQMSAFYAFPR